MKKKKSLKLNHTLIIILKSLLTLLIVIISNFYLQLSQNDWSWDLALKFAFSWHWEKFFLSCFVLLIFWLFWYGVSGSWGFSLFFYSVVIGILGFANYQKMYYRLEPIYPDDLKMISELGLMREMVGLWPFILCLAIIGIAIGVLIFAFYQSLFLEKQEQIIRISSFVLASLLLVYITNFNQPENFLRKQYDKTALWIPYSQKMNYYNTGFVAGFLYNLKVEPMTKPAEYSKAKIEEVVSRYEVGATGGMAEKPNIIYIMSESFSDPLRLEGIEAQVDPLKVYRQLAATTYAGQMLSQNYGGGTANIEFEALTSLSMEPFNPQLTTPYTMLVPKLEELPSIVSMLKAQDYQTTAIHPYNTSMYKRKDVYDVFGFDQFLSEAEMANTTKLEKNPYISDEAAYAEILELLQQNHPQFVHLVTMQTHMPYNNKYPQAEFGLASVENQDSISNYMQDIAYSSQALADFVAQLEELDRRSLVVFWGDHLPSIYSDSLQKDNLEVDLHLTEFLLYDTAMDLRDSIEGQTLLSPIFFGPHLFKAANLGSSDFYQLLQALEGVLPAFEKNNYLIDGKWQKELKQIGRAHV